MKKYIQNCIINVTQYHNVLHFRLHFVFRSPVLLALDLTEKRSVSRIFTDSDRSVFQVCEFSLFVFVCSVGFRFRLFQPAVLTEASGLCDCAQVVYYAKWLFLPSGHPIFVKTIVLLCPEVINSCSSSLEIPSVKYLAYNRHYTSVVIKSFMFTKTSYQKIITHSRS